MREQVDPRVQELEQLAQEEGIRLPMPVEMICYFERQGKVVDLETGQVYDAVTVQPSAIAQAVCHLLQGVEGEFSL